VSAVLQSDRIDPLSHWPQFYLQDWGCWHFRYVSKTPLSRANPLFSPRKAIDSTGVAVSNVRLVRRGRVMLDREVKELLIGSGAILMFAIALIYFQ
jgi:hypothetical protein